MAEKKKKTQTKILKYELTVGKPKVLTMGTATKSVKPRIATTGKTTKPAKAKSKKEPKYKNTLLNRIREDWHQPFATPIYKPSGSPFKANTLTDRTKQAAYDKYPYGSLTGRGKTNKSKKSKKKK